MKISTTCLSLALAACLAFQVPSVLRADEGQDRAGKPGAGKRGPQDGRRNGNMRPGQGKPGQGKPGAGRPGQGRPGQGNPGQGRPGMMGMDPAVAAARLLKKFDANGDEKLGVAELQELLTFIRERAGQGMQGRGGQGQGQAGRGMRKPGTNGDRAKRDMQKTRRSRSADANAQPGGDVPKRPQ